MTGRAHERAAGWGDTRCGGDAIAAGRSADRIALGLCCVGLALGCVGLALGCVGPGPPRPEASYRATVRAEVVVEADQPPRVYELVELGRPDRRRRHAAVNGRPTIQIDRRDLHVTWILDPTERRFSEHRLGIVDRAFPGVPDPFAPVGGAHFEPEAPTEAEDPSLRRYRVTSYAYEGIAWLHPDGVPARFVGDWLRGDERWPIDVRYEPIERVRFQPFAYEIPMSYAGYADRAQRAGAPDVHLQDEVRRARQRQRNTPPIGPGL